MDELVQELNQLRININEAAMSYQRALDESSNRERVLLVNIQGQ